MRTRVFIALLLGEPPDDDVAIAYEGVYTTIIRLDEAWAFAEDPVRRRRTLLIVGDDESVLHRR